MIRNIAVSTMCGQESECLNAILQPQLQELDPSSNRDAWTTCPCPAPSLLLALAGSVTVTLVRLRKAPAVSEDYVWSLAGEWWSGDLCYKTSHPMDANVWLYHAKAAFGGHALGSTFGCCVTWSLTFYGMCWDGLGEVHGCKWLM